MRRVARAAVPRENRLVDGFLDETRRRVRVASVADLVFPIPENPREIGTVGIVAGGTFTLRKRYMLRFRFQARLRLRVAGVA